MKPIVKFSGKYDFLSNFYLCAVYFESGKSKGRMYPSVEHAFQAAKTLDKNERARIASLPTPGMAKRAGRKVTLRENWDYIKFDVMTQLIVQKFSYPELAEKLIDTGDAELIEGNYWHDNYWGSCSCVRCDSIIPLNNLGVILMTARSELEMKC